MLVKTLSSAFALLIVAAPPAHAQPAPVSVTTENNKRLAIALAQAVAPPDLLLPLEVALARKGFAMGFEADPEAKELRKNYPELLDAVWKALEPEVRRASAEDQPKFHAELAKIYIARLSSAEMEGLRRFYLTPTGQKLMRKLYGSIDPSPIVAEAVKSQSISEQAMTAAKNAAQAEALAALAPEDFAALEELARTISMAKLHSLGQETQQATLKWINQEDPELDARIEKILADAVEKHIAEHARSR